MLHVRIFTHAVKDEISLSIFWHNNKQIEEKQ